MESPYYEMTHDFKEENLNTEMAYSNGYLKGYHDALMKQQEAVEPNTQHSSRGYWYTCGACGWWIFEVRDTGHFEDRKRFRFCASCGRAVKWE